MIEKELKQQKELKLKTLVTGLMQELNINFVEGTYKTPERVAKALLEIFASNFTSYKELEDQMTVFASDSCGEVVVKDIPFYSMCEHHLLPFFGKVTITYIPNELQLGLSKFHRVVNYFSRKAQVQERLTSEIGMFLVLHLDPKYLRVDIKDWRHMCMEMRGVNSTSTTDTNWTYTKEEGLNE